MPMPQKNTSITPPHITTSTPKMLPNTPRPVYFLVRPISGNVVPLIAADELPPAIQLGGVEKNMQIVDTIGMINLGLVEGPSGCYEVDYGRVSGGEEGDHRECDIDNEAARPSGSRSPNRTDLTTEAKEGVCRHWVQTSWCKWSNSCRYAHTMPMTIEGLQKLGVKNWPVWYRAAYPWLFRARLQSSNPVGPEPKKVAKRVDIQSDSSVTSGSGMNNSNKVSASSQRSASTAPSLEHDSDTYSDNNKTPLAKSLAKTKTVSQQKCNVGRKQEALRPQSANFMIKTRPHKSIYEGATIPRGPLINDETTGRPLCEVLPQSRSPAQTHRDRVENKPFHSLPAYRRGQAHAKKSSRKEFGRQMMPAPLTRDVLARLRSGDRGSSGSTMREARRVMGLEGERGIGVQAVQSSGNRSSRSVDDADMTRRDSVNEWEVENEVCDEELVKI